MLLELAKPEDEIIVFYTKKLSMYVVCIRD